jgi:hypothetical protein
MKLTTYYEQLIHYKTNTHGEISRLPAGFQFPKVGILTVGSNGMLATPTGKYHH